MFTSNAFCVLKSAFLRLCAVLLILSSPLDLEYLAARPCHQKRGARTLLVNHILLVADADPKTRECYPESSPAGHSLYKSCGFEDRDIHETEVSDGEVYMNWLMVRGPGGRKELQN
jgi:hypothetical protein